MHGKQEDTTGKPEDATRRVRQHCPALRELRMKDGWSQEGLAKASRLTQSAYSRIETGQANAHVSTLNRIARALRVPVAAIMRELDDADCESSAA